MKIKHHIKRFFTLALWITIGAGIMVLLVAAIRDRSDQTCRGYSIRITGSGEQRFMNEERVVDMLKVNGSIRGRSIKRFDLRSIESKLESHPWVRNAELFFDNNQVLQVRIEEKEPLARVFTTDGNSFYISRNGEWLPLSERYSARLPVFTNFPGSKGAKTQADSLLVLNMERVSDFLLKNPFWMSQVAQIDITRDRQFEIVPLVGNHIIEFGGGEGCENKFHRLMLFYQQVLSKVGMDAYERIKVQFEGQVVGVKK